MKTICLYFQVHQPLRLKTYRFFNMGKDHNYLDDFANRSVMQRVASECYLPMNDLLLGLVREYAGKFRVSFSISGLALEQFRAYAPEVLEGFRRLACTGCVEFLAGTYSHSLAALANREEFERQVSQHAELIRSEFGLNPTAFANTELIYSDEIGSWVASMGYRVMLAEGARHVLGWKSPNFVYANALNQRLRLLLRNYRLSDDIAFQFADPSWDGWPLTADKFAGWLGSESQPGEIINLFMDYETFGDHLKAGTGIFDFMRYLPGEVLRNPDLQFATVTECAENHAPVGILHAPHPVSWADEERDITAWLGNELQTEAFDTLYRQQEKVNTLRSPDFDYVWRFMQAADHFHFMSTKCFSDGNFDHIANPYPSAYEAFINYMNVLSDFIIELDRMQDKSGAKIEVPECVPEQNVRSGKKSSGKNGKVSAGSGTTGAAGMRAETDECRPVRSRKAKTVKQ